jgi:hypothetical protein
MVWKKAFGVLIALAIVVALLLSLHVYYIQTGSGGDLFWNSEDAYVFIGMADRGYRFSYLGFLMEQIKELYPFATSLPSDKHFSVLALHVTPDLVQHYSVDNFRLGSAPEPFHGMLYAGNMLPGGGLLKWSRTQFEPITPEEAGKYYQYARELPKGPPAGPSYDNVEGWSKRTVGGDVIRESPTNYVENNSTATIELGGKLLTFILNSGFISHEAYIDLIRPGQPPERIWHLDEHMHRVSRAEYYKVFGNRSVSNQRPKP